MVTLCLGVSSWLRTCLGSLLFIVAYGDAVKFEPVANKFETMAFSDLALQGLDLLVMEFKNRATANIDQVVVMIVGGFFITSAAIAKIMLFKIIQML